MSNLASGDDAAGHGHRKASCTRRQARTTLIHGAPGTPCHRCYNRAPQPRDHSDGPLASAGGGRDAV